MKNLILYLVIPAAMMIAFLFTPSAGYFASQKQIAEKARLRQVEAAKQKAEEDARRKLLDAQAEEDAKKRQAQREAEENAKREKREKEYQDGINKLLDDIATFQGEADKLAKESADLDARLNKLRNNKETLTRDSFELAKQVELAKIGRRTAEMEIQRMVDMVGQRLSASTLAQPPPPPPPAKN